MSSQPEWEQLWQGNLDRKAHTSRLTRTDCICGWRRDTVEPLFLPPAGYVYVLLFLHNLHCEDPWGPTNTFNEFPSSDAKQIVYIHVCYPEPVLPAVSLHVIAIPFVYNVFIPYCFLSRYYMCFIYLFSLYFRYTYLTVSVVESKDFTNILDPWISETASTVCQASHHTRVHAHVLVRSLAEHTITKRGPTSSHT